MKDFLPPKLVTFVDRFLHASIANERDAHVMKSFVFAFWCQQAVTNLAPVVKSPIHPAHVAEVFTQHEVGHGLDANSNKNSCTEILDIKAQRIYFAPKKDC